MRSVVRLVALAGGILRHLFFFQTANVVKDDTAQLSGSRTSGLRFDGRLNHSVVRAGRR